MMLRVALIGCGGISAEHARAARELPELLRYTVAVDEDPSRASTRAAEAGAEALTDWRAALQRADVDAVDICLPHDLHAEVAVAAARAGKHVLVEKPLATTMADADAMLAAAREAGVVLMVAFCERYMPLYQRVKEIVASGALGRPLMARIDHNQWVVAPPGHWIRSRQRLGGGCVSSAGCHRLDLLRWFLGEPEAVSAMTVQRPEQMEGEVGGLVNLRFPSGAIGNLAILWSALLPPWYEELWIDGEEGRLHTHGGLHVASRRTGTDEVLLVPAGDGFTGELRHFAECVRDGRMPLTSGEDARKTLAVCLAAYESERGSCVVDPRTLLGGV
jgi:UDP-N-acetyl-2-amino-2-deoxyglucuronate dehydrogenase